MGHRGGQDVLGKRQIYCSYQNRTPDLSPRRINTVLFFTIIFITGFKLHGLDFEILLLNYERYTIHERNEPLLNAENRRLI
jgi:predicted membrane protein